MALHAFTFSAALLCAHSLRRGSKEKLVAGVPILNYHLREGSQVQGSAEEEWVIVLKSSVNPEVIDNLCRQSRLSCKVLGRPSQGGTAFFNLRGTESDLERVLEANSGLVRFVEPDLPVHAIPDFDEEDEEVQVSAASWGLSRIGANQRATQGSGTHVYVLDTGIRASHSDFGGRVVPTLDMTSGSIVECGGELTCAGDAQGHGTHCAGTAGGTRYGVAPQTTLHSAKVLSDSGRGRLSWVIAAINWVTSEGDRPAVVSMSLGGSGQQSSEEVAIDAAVATGVVVVVAGGNSNSDACGFSPAFVPSAITVGSTDSGDSRSSFSNYGTCTDIWAPGGRITSASHRGDNFASSKSGTSMACPHVAGAAALLMEANPGATPKEVRETLLANAIVDAINGLKADDTNSLLYVGEGGAPSAPPTTDGPSPCPSAYSTGPDAWGDCMCKGSLSCYEAGDTGCTCSTPGVYSQVYFLPKCTDCICK